MADNIRKPKIGFVILHYNQIEITIKCVDSILSLEENDRIEIVIVDNNSTNGTGIELKKYYQDKRIKIFLLDQNYGFSKANNIGYKYLLKNSSCSFVIVANNDVIFFQKDMINLLETEYEKRGFFVAGPDILSVDKMNHQNPLARAPRSESDTLKRIKLNKRKLRYIRIETLLHWLWLRINKTKIYKIYRKIVDNNSGEQIIDWTKEQDDIVLHGACLIFSSLFLQLKVSPFQPETFFYYEEDILADRCLRQGWKISYIPQIEVKHFEAASTEKRGYYRKMKFRYCNLINAGKLYLKYLREMR